MYTPFEILQLKQKQRKYQLNVTQSKQHRALYLKFDKQPQNIKTNQSSQSFNKSIPNNISKTVNQGDQIISNRSATTKSQKRYKSEEAKSKDKKYQIICRESIRKVNTYRAKVYHTHRTFKDQSFTLNFNTFKQKQNGRLASCEKKNILLDNNETKPKTAQEFVLKSKTNYNINNSITENQGRKESQIIKFKIFLDKAICFHSQEIGLDIPQFLVQKCKLNQTDQKQKEKIQRAIEKLYDRNIINDSQHGEVIHSVKGFSNSHMFFSVNPQKDNKRNLKSDNQKQRLNQQRQFHQQGFKNRQKLPNDNFKSLIQNYHQKDLSLQQTFNSMNEYQNQPQIQSISNKQPQNFMNGKQFMNFIKKSKKKRLPVSRNINRKTKNQGIQQPQDGYFQFRRTITQDSKKESNILFTNVRKTSISPTKIKFNTIDQKISGWQIDLLQAYDPNSTTTGRQQYKK